MSLDPTTKRRRPSTPPPPPPTRKRVPERQPPVSKEPAPGATIPISIEDIILEATELR